MSVGYFADLFDLINVRDLDLIAQARSGCTRLVLGVLTDDDAESRFGRRPVVPFVERAALLRHVRGVAEVVAHEGWDRGRAADAQVVFMASDRTATVVPDAVALVPQRESASRILRRALRPTETAIAC